MTSNKYMNYWVLYVLIDILLEGFARLIQMKS